MVSKLITYLLVASFITYCNVLAKPAGNSTTRRPTKTNSNNRSAKPKKIIGDDDPVDLGVRITVPPDKTSIYYTAEHCKRKLCKLPNCSCGGRVIPGDLPAEKIPQIVLLTFDDSVNAINWPLYISLFNGKRVNPNGCPISATFYVSHEWTDYSNINTLYSQGHEIASHSITHSSGANFNPGRWWREIEGQREIISDLGQIPIEEIRGMRAPFLQPGGENQFAMLHSSNFSYDSTLTIGDPSSWPYTFDYKIPHRCRLEDCPTLSFPGLWEVPLAMITGANGRGCSMADSCSYGATVDSVKRTFMKNFESHYNGNRAPLGLYFHYAFFATPHYKAGFFDFVDEILKLDDVYFVTTWQAVQWIREPRTVDQLATFEPWNCRKLRAHSAEDECTKPKTCALKFRWQDRPIFTCGRCPNTYPWLDNFRGD